MQRRAGLALTFGVLLMSCLQGSARPAPPEGFRQSFPLRSEDPAFGGLSAVEVLDETHLLVLGDKGTLAKVTLRRNDKGKVTGAAVGKIVRLNGQDGKPLPKKLNDAEGMTLAEDGSIVVSFEGKPARFGRYHTADGPERPLPSVKAFGKLPRNGAFEALASDAEGRLYAIPEGYPGNPDSLPVFRLINDHWDRKLSVPKRGGFLPVAADIGPDGWLYLLERDYVAPLAFASRLRRFEIGDEALTSEEILFETALGVHDNLEGLSIWRDGQGVLRATMVSDNNFQWFLGSDLVEYRLPD